MHFLQKFQSLLLTAGASIPPTFCGRFIPSTFCRSFYSFNLLPELLFFPPSAGVSIPSTFCRSFYSFHLLQEILLLSPAAGASIPSSYTSTPTAGAPIASTFCWSFCSFHLLQEFLFLPPSIGVSIPSTFCRSCFPPSAGAPIPSTFCRSSYSFHLLQELLFLPPSAGAPIPSTFCRSSHVGVLQLVASPQPPAHLPPKVVDKIDGNRWTLPLICSFSMRETRPGNMLILRRLFTCLENWLPSTGPLFYIVFIGKICKKTLQGGLLGGGGAHGERLYNL